MKTKKEVLTCYMWDWKESIEASDINSMVKYGCKHFYQPTTMGDFYVMIGSTFKLDEKSLDDLWSKIEACEDWHFTGKSKKEIYAKIEKGYADALVSE